MTGSSLSWWFRNRKKCALPVACFTGFLVWLAGARRKEAPFAGAGPHDVLKRPAKAPETAAAKEKTPEEEPSQDRAPKEISEILRTDPRGTQTEDRAPVWGFLQRLEGLVPGKEGEWFLGADEALSWLRAADQAAPEIEAGLISLALDQKLPSALREYALQHLGVWAEEHSVSLIVRETLKNVALAEEASPLSGIALAALFRSGFGPQETAWIHQQGLHLASSRAAHPLSRSLALQILGQSGAAAAEPIARALFREAASTVREKIEALQVLRWVGTRETLVWLSSFSEASEPLTAAAQRQTVESLRERWRKAE